ncbi:MAG: methionyl-tRNA formyltransferase [Anaerolineae bacterium]|nr:methionyl-tRNA formyltransferase [Anaerolineae bacterium]
MGTPKFALPALERLCAHYPVVGVVTQPDRPAGRGRQLVASPVKKLALADGIPVYQPQKLRRVDAIENIRAWAPDLIVVAAYGQIIPEAILSLPRYGVLNIHPSLLPRWRGASPVQSTILAGDSVTGVTIMLLDEGLDTGPIISQQEVVIMPGETAGELEDRLAEIGADLLLETLPDYLSGKLKPQPQSNAEVTICRRITKDAAEITWTDPAKDLENKVRAFAPKPGAYTTWQNQHFKILQAYAAIRDAETEDLAPGIVITQEDFPAVVTGEGVLVLTQVQMAGKRPMMGNTFLRGQRAFVGAVLGPQEPGD